LEALEAAQRKLLSLSPGQPKLLHSATRNRLKTVLPLFRDEVAGRDGVVGQQTEATSAARRKKKELRLYVRHFFKALSMAIDRGHGFRPGDRGYYGLDANQETLPNLAREADLLRVAQAIVDGEARRVAAGGKRITMPSAKEIGRLLREVRGLLACKTQLVATVDRESDDVIQLREDVADLVRDIWDELEFAWRKESASTRRRRCREWGVVYGERRAERGKAEADPDPDEKKSNFSVASTGRDVNLAQQSP
jgi:hypothetical protein